MANLTITVPNAIVPRIQAAYGHRDVNNPTVWVPATVAEIQEAIKAVIREKVINYETTAAAEADRVTRSAEAAAW